MMRYVITTTAAAAFALGLVMPASTLAEMESTSITTTEKTTTRDGLNGTLVVKDRATRSFTFDGEDRVYTAPEDVDISTYEGSKVEIDVDDGGRVTSVKRHTEVERKAN